LARAFHAVTFKAEYVCDYGMPHRLSNADRIISALCLARLFHGRHKFYHFAPWYRRILSPYLREMLLDSRTLKRPYLDAARVQAMVNSHIAGTHNFTAEIHRVLTAELLHRL